MNLMEADTLIRTGIAGLDAVLDGGLTPHRLYLVEGVPGSGKTTMALQFLLEGLARGETVLYVTLSETEEELREVAASHGWDLEGMHIYELFPLGDQLDPEAQYTMFHPSEVELGETTQRILQQVEAVRPQRVVFDSLAEIRLLSGSPLRFRRQVLALRQYFAGRGITVLLLDETQISDQGLHVHTIVHGVIELDQLRPEFGGDRRQLRVTKMRGRDFRSGNHDYLIATGGVQAFPRLVAAHHRREGVNEEIDSGLPALDTLLGGGLQRGTSTLLIGAAGTGKSSLASHFMVAAARRGERSALFLFDESTRTFLTRSRGQGLELERHCQDGLISIQPVDPGELSPGQFIQGIRDAVEKHDARLVLIDSLSGYLSAMLEESFVLVQMHDLLTYLAQLGVVTLLINSQQGLVGHMATTLDISYLADTVILLRYYEMQGEVRQAISVLKKRTGAHERTIRELSVTDEGLHIGEPLRNFRGVLTGVPYEVGHQPVVTELPSAAPPAPARGAGDRR